MFRSSGPRTLHGAFDWQTKQTPEALAVVCWSPGAPGHQTRLSYGQICARSWVLAAGLAECWPKGEGGLGIDAAPGLPPDVLAIELSRSHPDFLPLLVAASRLQLPFALLSTDLPQRKLQEDRAALVLRLLRPRLLVAEAAAEGRGVDTVALPLVANRGQSSYPFPGAQKDGHYQWRRTPAPEAPRPILCVLFTGGTRRTKAVQVTHEMLLHERATYREVWAPSGGPPVVLAHTSVYWGASALGQLSIALAHGGACVWTEVRETPALLDCILQERVTVLGLVPDQLDVLSAEPTRELPGVECVFTWGERLPRLVAERWRGHPRAALRELLIATEYWLSLWADPLGSSPGVLRTVRGVEIRLEPRAPRSWSGAARRWVPTSASSASRAPWSRRATSWLRKAELVASTAVPRAATPRFGPATSSAGSPEGWSTRAGWT